MVRCLRRQPVHPAQAVRGRRLRARHQFLRQPSLHRGQVPVGGHGSRTRRSRRRCSSPTPSSRSPSRTAARSWSNPAANRSVTRTSCGSAERWRELVGTIPLPFVQCGPVIGTKWLEGAEAVPTTTFRQTLAVLSVCRALVTTEGGLMHGAAAVGTPAVVLWSGSSHRMSPATGSTTTSAMPIRTCGGMRVNCPSCRKSMGNHRPRGCGRTHGDPER